MWQALLLLAIIGAASAKTNPPPGTGYNNACQGTAPCYQPNPVGCDPTAPDKTYPPACSVAAETATVSVNGVEYTVTPFLGTWIELKAAYPGTTGNSVNPLWQPLANSGNAEPVNRYAQITAGLQSKWGAGYVNNQTGTADNPPNSSPFCPFDINGKGHVQSAAYTFNKDMTYPKKADDATEVDASEVEWWCGWKLLDETPPLDNGTTVGDPHLKVRGGAVQ